MSVIDFLLNRCSQSKLTEPAPSQSELELILQAGFRVPDHGHLRPYRFYVHQGEGRQQLADVLERAAKNNPDLDESVAVKAPTLPFRAPVIITVVAKIQEHPKVPAKEQLLTAGCAVMAMQQAALALGYGGIWRTGVFSADPYVKQAFKASEQDEIVGFLYLGTPDQSLKAAPMPELANYVAFIND